MSDKTLVLVPYWVANRIAAKNLPLSVCLDYMKMRELFPLEEIAIFVAFQKYKFGLFSKYVDLDTGRSLYCEQIGDDPDLMMEYNSICELSDGSWYSGDSEERKKFNSVEIKTNERLRIDKVDKDLIEPDSYSIVDFDINRYALVIKPGFLESTENIETVFNLVKDLLKISYMYSPVHDVSNTSVFRAYVKLLDKKVTGLL